MVRDSFCAAKWEVPHIAIYASIPDHATHPVSISLSSHPQTSPTHPSSPSFHLAHTTHLPASAPHALQEPIPLCQSVDAVVTLTHLAHEAAERKDVVLASVASVVVDLCDGDLDRGVVLGLDDAVCGGALAGDVTIVGDGG
jgi:hypothetical protein